MLAVILSVCIPEIQAEDSLHHFRTSRADLVLLLRHALNRLDPSPEQRILAFLEDYRRIQENVQNAMGRYSAGAFSQIGNQ